MRRCQDLNEPPAQLWKALADAGFIGINLPTEYGGGGMGLTGLRIVAEEAAAAGALLVMIVMSSGIAGPILAKHGTEQQKQCWLPSMAYGRTKLSFAITEADTGSNSRNPATAVVYCSGSRADSPLLRASACGLASISQWRWTEKADGIGSAQFAA